jgi:hypothetical protein
VELRSKVRAALLATFEMTFVHRDVVQGERSLNKENLRKYQHGP